MNALSPPTGGLTRLPDHKDLPCEDGAIVNNFLEHPQCILLTDSIWPVLEAQHPDGQFAIGQDCGIYWRMTNPPEKGAVSPDWSYVPDVPPMLDGEMRRSYVLWQEHVSPLIVIEIVSGNGSEERDRTPREGKFWIYENAIHAGYYAIYDGERTTLEVHQLHGNRYKPVIANAMGRFPIAEMGVELGLWHGSYRGMEYPWLRWWDRNENLLLAGEEREKIAMNQNRRERERAEQEKQRAEQEKQRAEKLAAPMRALGVEPEA